MKKISLDTVNILKIWKLHRKACKKCFQMHRKHFRFVSIFTPKNGKNDFVGLFFLIFSVFLQYIWIFYYIYWFMEWKQTFHLLWTILKKCSVYEILNCLFSVYSTLPLQEALLRARYVSLRFARNHLWSLFCQSWANGCGY